MTDVVEQSSIDVKSAEAKSLVDQGLAVVVGEELVQLLKSNLEVNETNLNEFLSNFASTYDYYSRKHHRAARVLSAIENNYEKLYCEKYILYKEQSCTDKLSDSKAKIDPEVISLKGQVKEAKYRKDMIWGYLRSLDKAHENAIQLGYNLRKEMDKLHGGIKDIYPNAN